MKKNAKIKVIALLMSLFLITFGSIGFSQDFFINGENMTNEQYLEYMMDIIKRDYKYEITEDELYNGIFKGLFESLDKHSVYFEPTEYKEFSVSSIGEFGGIGITIELNKDGYISVVGPIKGTPGFRAGIKTGDVIQEVNGENIKDWPLEKSLKVMRGKAGDPVLLGIQKFGESKITNVNIIREIIKINPVEYEINDDGVGILRITIFNQNASESVLEALEYFKSKNIKGLVIDLRGNPGGSLSEVLNIADYFVEANKELLYIDIKGENDEIYKGLTNPILKKMPMAVLINESSASASEILSGVLQDYGLAKIIGSNSYGKGTVQNVFDLPNGSGLKITIAEYLTPSRNKIDGVGIKPDIEIKDENLLLKNNLDAISLFVPMAEKVEYKTIGDIGLNVFGAQQRLALLGYETDTTGTFDSKTKESIKKFQLDYNLNSNGALDLKTVDKINELFGLGATDLDKVLDKALEFIKSN